MSTSRIASLRLLLVLFGVAIISLDLIIDPLLDAAPDFGPYQVLAVFGGIATVLMGFLVPAKHIPSFLLTTTLTIVALLVVSAVFDAAFHLMGWDFARQEDAFRSWPTYYRKPIVPDGEIYFKRPGPETWSGRPLSVFSMKVGLTNEPYIDEREITVTYDADGFRNPNELIDWDIVVVGDSFVELGHLKYEDLFTTQLGKSLNCKVKYLGVSYTGPLAYIHYLKKYGKSLSAEHAIMVFFEGNDLGDLKGENDDLEHYKATGRRPYRNFEKQSSFVRAASRWILGRAEILPKLAPSFEGNNNWFAPNAYFQGTENIPVTLGNAPLGSAQLTPKDKSLLASAVAEWSRAAGSLGMKPWLLYMPCKERVLHGHLTFMTHATEAIVAWQPTDLPELLRNLSHQNHVEFIDPTASLVAETAKGVLTYNPLADTHLNHYGSQIVARVVSTALGAYFSKEQKVKAVMRHAPQHSSS